MRVTTGRENESVANLDSVDSSPPRHRVDHSCVPTRQIELEGPRWLVLLLQGVRRSDITRELCPNLHELIQSAPDTPLEADVGRAHLDQFFDALPLEELRDRGLHLDRRSIALRPAWQSDRTVIDSLADRPLGRADAIVLWMRDVECAAIRCGLATAGHEQALRDLDADVLRASQMLQRDGAKPHVVAITYGALDPVDRTFDALAAMRLAVPAKVWRRLTFTTERSHIRFACGSMRDTSVCLEAMCAVPFTNHGRVLASEELDAHGVPHRPNELTFVPFEHVAIGRRDAKAAPRYLPEANEDSVSLPWLEAPLPSISIEDVAAEFASRTREKLRLIPRPEKTFAEDMADYPDLLSVLDADVRKLLGIGTPSEK